MENKRINYGKRFEEDFIKSIPSHFFTYRFKDGGGWSNATNLRFTSSNICDFMVFDGKELYLLELKSVKGKSFSFNNIGNHLDEMCKASKFYNIKAYYIINFREENKTFIVNSENLKNLTLKDKKSVNIKELESLGFSTIPQELKRTRWKYDFIE